MKKMLLSLFFLFIPVLIFAESTILKITFQPNKFVNKSFNYISEYKYEYSSEIIECLINSKKVVFPIFIPKAEIWEGIYTLSIYDENNCIGVFTITNENYIYDEQNQCFRKAKNILKTLRSFLYIEYLRS